MKKVFKKIAASVMAVATLAVGVVGMNVSAADADVIEPSIAYDLDLNVTRASGSFPFNVTTLTNYGKFTATKSTITASFNNCSNGAALVKIHKTGYTGTVVGNFVVPAGSGIPTQYVNISVSSGTTYYITVQPTEDYIQAKGSFGLNY